MSSCSIMCSLFFLYVNRYNLYIFYDIFKVLSSSLSFYINLNSFSICVITVEACWFLIFAHCNFASLVKGTNIQISPVMYKFFSFFPHIFFLTDVSVVSDMKHPHGTVVHSLVHGSMPAFGSE